MGEGFFALRRLRYGLQGSAVVLLVAVSTVVLTTVIAALSVFKLGAPGGRARNRMTRCLSALGELWIAFNQGLTRCYRRLEWDVQLPEGIEHDGRYLVFCNHRSWVDILVLQHCLNRRAPFMRFLLKRQLIWVPFLGIAWWALDMVFLRRYSRRELLRRPELRGKDLENAARACEKLRHIPVSMMTFPEGTRFTAAKHQRQNSPYRHLLRPRYGGIGQVLQSFGGALEGVIDVTIVYPEGTPNLWQFVSGQVRKITVRTRLRPIEAAVRDRDFTSDAGAKAGLKRWINRIWEEKDCEIAGLVAAGRGEGGCGVPGPWAAEAAENSADGRR